MPVDALLKVKRWKAAGGWNILTMTILFGLPPRAVDVIYTSKFKIRVHGKHQQSSAESEMFMQNKIVGCEIPH
jgi:hypothetical protein